ncbi:MAG: response regulator, partial [Deltaproteobacteria bacterium]|nr:response regulator [Deltaproteobacteria bacterium]
MYSTHPPGSHDELPVILCISEDKTFLNTIRSGLGYAGFVAVATSSAAEAIELIGETSIDAVICDYELSQTNGIAFFEEANALRSDETPPTLIVG